VRLVDWDGTVHQSVDYDAWGTSTTTGPATVRETFGFRGGYRDEHTHLLNFGARWYDPALGRWLTQDPLLAITGGIGRDALPFHGELSNLYRYVSNNPLGLWDPSGLIAWLPKGWPQPPGWKGGFKWKNAGQDKLIDADGETWHWHPEDEGHNEHWDKGTGRDKVRVDRNGKPLGDDAFKPEEGEGAKEEGDAEKGGDTSKRFAEAGSTAVVAVGTGVMLWEIGKWATAIFFAPETLGGSLAAAAVTP